MRPGEERSSPVDLVTVPEPIEHSVVGMPNEVGSSSMGSVAVPETIQHSGVRGTADPPSTGQPMKHSDTSRDWKNGRQNQTGDGNTPQDVRTGDQQISPNDGEAIVVGAVGSAAPWFLMGWAAEVEIEFMIDTGCQVTILATSVFERMCVSDRMRSRLRPCGRRLVSADSSPLIVKGELEMTVVFLGLSCDMLLVVASIGSDGLLGTEALQSCLPHQLDLRTWQLWSEGRSTLQLHQQRLTPSAAAFLTNSVVLPPDSETLFTGRTLYGLSRELWCDSGTHAG